MFFFGIYYIVIFVILSRFEGGFRLTTIFTRNVLWSAREWSGFDRKSSVILMKKKSGKMIKYKVLRVVASSDRLQNTWTDGFGKPTFCKAWGGLSTVYFCVFLLLNPVKMTVSRFSKAKSADQVSFWYSVTRTNEPRVSTQTRECTFAMEGLLCVKKFFSQASKHRTDWFGKRVTSLEKNPTIIPKN